jgi:hypothetical protein
LSSFKLKIQTGRLIEKAECTSFTALSEGRTFLPRTGAPSREHFLPSCFPLLPQRGYYFFPTFFAFSSSSTINHLSPKTSSIKLLTTSHPAERK